MIYKRYTLALFIRIVLLAAFLMGFAFSLRFSRLYFLVISVVLALFTLYDLLWFILRRFREMDDFFEAVKYKDFSRWFVEDRGPQDIRELHKGFNAVNRTIKEMNAARETHYVYLQKILEMVEVGIIAYNVETQEILWANDALQEILNIPAFKSIRYIRQRNPTIYRKVFEEVHLTGSPIVLEIGNEKLKVLVSETVFRADEHSFKLIVLQNIDTPLSKNESEAWKKLLSVMTHEIMNSIAPISSLAESLKEQLEFAEKKPKGNPLNLNDLNAGISSIQKRSEGLLKFAKTYRSLNKVTQLNLEKAHIGDLFLELEKLLQASLKTAKVQLEFHLPNPALQLEMDRYLIEQVLLNLVRNAVDACAENPEGLVHISASEIDKGKIQFEVADNGKGIPPEIRDRVFVPFFTTKKEGSGIGLSLCKQIMLLHGGKIQLQSREKQGTVVRLIFERKIP